MTWHSSKKACTTCICIWLDHVVLHKEMDNFSISKKKIVWTGVCVCVFIFLCFRYLQCNCDFKELCVGRGEVGGVMKQKSRNCKCNTNGSQLCESFWSKKMSKVRFSLSMTGLVFRVVCRWRGSRTSAGIAWLACCWLCRRLPWPVLCVRKKRSLLSARSSGKRMLTLRWCPRYVLAQEEPSTKRLPAF